MTLSPQLIEFSQAWIDEDDITFDVLADFGLGVARDFGLSHKLPDYLRRLYVEELGIDLVRFNGDESWEVPLAATFVVNQSGTIVFSSANTDYTVRPEPSEVLAAIPAQDLTA